VRIYESSEIRTLLNQASKANFRLLPLTGSPTDTIPLVAALRRGEIVAMLGDRAYGSPSAGISFFGETAPFPIGAYVMAAIAGAPLVHVFNLREHGGHYRFIAFPPQRPQMPSHEQRDAYLRDCAGRFARDLESIVRRDPLQWYNFYPFWEKADGDSKPQQKVNPENRTPGDPPTPVLSPSNGQREKSALASAKMDEREFSAVTTRAAAKRLD
jgi:predicted LPLAT superfamily acyltransferase